MTGNDLQDGSPDREGRPQPQAGGLLRSTAVVGGMTFLSRILGPGARCGVRALFSVRGW